MLRATLSAGRKHGLEFALFAASTGVYQGARFTFSLAAAYALGPAEFSGWALLVALLVYAPSILLGVVNGMNRELPTLTGAGRHSDGDRVESTTWTFALLAAGVVGLTLVSAAIVASSAWLLAIGLLAVGTVVYHTQQLVLRSRLRFNAASLQQAVAGIATLAATGALLAAGTTNFVFVVGLYAGAVGLGVASGAIARIPPLSLNSAEALRLARVGFPIMLAGLAFSLLVTLDRWIGVTLLGPAQAAPYALASLIAAALLVVPAIVSQQVYPRMAIARGRGSDDASLRRMAFQQGLGAASLASALAAAVILFAVFGIPAFLPAYAAGVPAIVILGLGLVPLALSSGYGNYLNVTGGQWSYLRVQLIALTVGVSFMAAGGLTAGITGIAAGAALTHGCYGLMLWLVARRHGATEGMPAAGSLPSDIPG